MTVRPPALRPLARRDVEEAVERLRRDAGPGTALRFVDDLERALAAVAAHPEAGSPRYAHELDLPGLRHRRLDAFPYLVFYAPGPDGPDVWRVLHGARDVPALLRPPGEG